MAAAIGRIDLYFRLKIDWERSNASAGNIDVGMCSDAAAIGLGRNRLSCR